MRTKHPRAKVQVQLCKVPTERERCKAEHGVRHLMGCSSSTCSYLPQPSAKQNQNNNNDMKTQAGSSRRRSLSRTTFAATVPVYILRGNFWTARNAEKRNQATLKAFRIQAWPSALHSHHDGSDFPAILQCRHVQACALVPHTHALTGKSLEWGASFWTLLKILHRCCNTIQNTGNIYFKTVKQYGENLDLITERSTEQKMSVIKSDFN